MKREGNCINNSNNPIGVMINKTDFERQLVDKYKYTMKAAKMLVADFLENLHDNLRVGNNVRFHGTGEFQVFCRKGRLQHDVASKEYIEVPDKFYVKFTPGNGLVGAMRQLQQDAKPVEMRSS